MRIVSFVDSLELGGAEKMALSISNMLLEDVDLIGLVSLRGRGPLESKINSQIEYLPLGKKSVLDFISFYRLYRFIRKNNFEIIHAHSSTVIWALLLKLSGCKVKVLWHDHYGGRDLDKSNLRRSIKFLGSSIDFVISVSDELFQWSKKHFPKSNLILLDNFPELQELKLERKVDILHLANFRPQKDHFTLLDSLKILKDEFNLKPTFSCVGSFVDTHYSNVIKKRLVELGLDSQCQYFGPSENPEEFLFSSKIGILSSKSEGLPVSLLEYGFCGLFPICTDVGECKRVVHSNGFVVQSNDPFELARAVKNAIEDEDLNTKALAFQNKIIREYGKQKFKSNYLDFLKLN